MRKRARVQLIGEVTGVGAQQGPGLLRAARRPGRGSLRDLAQRPGEGRAARGGAARRRRTGDRRRPRLLPRRRCRPRPASASAPPTCGWRGRATCWRGWRRCASSCAPRACSSCRSSWRGRCCRRRSAWSRPNPAPPGATSWRGSRAAAGAGPWSGPSRRSRTATRRRRSRAAIQGLAARPEVEAIVVTRGGGSLADLWAFCDETLCRTVAMLRVPVVSAIGHERDTTLIDDVAAVACSTPTHAAEAAVPLDCGAARPRAERASLFAAAGGRRGGRGARPAPGGAGARAGAGAAARAQRSQPEDPRDPCLLRTRAGRARRLPAADRRPRPRARPAARDRAHRRRDRRGDAAAARRSSARPRERWSGAVRRCGGPP